MFNSFYIANFRSFKELTIPNLGRVNLIVGKNSVGKTTLLEALWLYASQMRPEAIHDVLVAREELLTEQDPESREVEVDIPALFFGRRFGPEYNNDIVLGPATDSHEQMGLRMTWVERTLSSEPAPPTYVEYTEEDFEIADGEVFPALKTMQGDSEQFFVKRYDSWFRTLRRTRGRSVESSPPFLRAGSVDSEMIGRWWDAVSLTESEATVIDFLNLLVPIERISLVEHPRRYGGRIFVTRLSGRRTPQPLKSLGDGVERVFLTALSLAYARQRMNSDDRSPLPPGSLSSGRDILLIDEIEEGVHFSAIHQYWQLIFQMAYQLNVQVFATTHSWDCIEGFQKAAIEDGRSEGILIRVERHNEDTRAVVIGERDLEVIARDNIEVR
ncbi:MAG: ATP-binding protein [Planctomycetota bacterium]|nr:MAG: ATP-binding protein [Planctomycetota bacterium]REJ90411.1 MAG: ATP-binding protein [Planctomycetota bacterium]REK24974.1 MAG: ATP-binding protein [Planctomycetota bacterium]REK36091.1 MAG: ATP-binding protein [Planctomycetota bacterium]